MWGCARVAAEGQVDAVSVPTRHPYTIRRMGDLVLDLAPPEETPTTRLDLGPRVPFAART